MSDDKKKQLADAAAERVKTEASANRASVTEPSGVVIGLKPIHFVVIAAALVVAYLAFKHFHR